MVAGFALHELIFDEQGNPVDYVTTDVNKAFEAQLNAPRGAVIGVKASAILPPAELAHWLSVFSLVVLTGQPTYYEMHSPLNGKTFEGCAFCPEKGKFAVTFTDITDRKRAEEALRESEHLFRTLSENALTGIYIVQDGRLVYVNQALARTFGYEPGELIGADPMIVIHPDDQELVTENIRRRMSGEVNALRYEFRGKLKAGTPNHIEMLGSRAEINGRPAIIGNIVDITERTQAKEALEASESQLREILENSLGAIYKRDLRTNTYEYISPSITRILGYTPDEMKAMTVETTLGLMHPDDINRVERVVAEANTGSPEASYQAVYRFKRKNGSYCWLQDRFRVLCDASGQALAWIGSVVDITERKRSEEELKQSEQIYRHIIESSPIPYALNDDHQNIILVNSAFVQTFGYTLDDIPTLDKWWSQAYPDLEYRQWVATTWQERLEKARSEGHELPPMEVTIHCKNGQMRSVLSSAQSLTGSFTGVHLVVLYDITDRKQMELALRRSVEEKDVLMRELQHRVKNSLSLAASLIGLEENNLPDERSRAIFANTCRRLQSMAAVYDQLYRSGGLDRVNLHQFVQDLVTGLSQSYLTSDRSVRIETQLEGMELDLKRTLSLGIILNELITNSIKHAFQHDATQQTEPGCIRVTLAQSGGQVKLCVADNGAGFSASALQSGGMGLELVKILSGQIGGIFSIENRNGCLACVTFSLES